MENKAADTNYNYKKILFDASLVIAIITFTGYMMIYSFEWGVYHQYAIPKELVGIDNGHLIYLWMAFKIPLILLFISTFILAYIYSIYPKTRIKIQKHKHLILIIPIAAYAIVTKTYKFWEYGILTMAVSLLIVFILNFLEPILNMKIKFLKKITSIIEPALKSIHIFINILFYLLFSAFLIYGSYYNGMFYAVQKREYTILSNIDDTYFVLTKNSDTYICVKEEYKLDKNDSIYYYLGFSLLSLDEIGRRNLQMTTLRDIKLGEDYKKYIDKLKAYKESQIKKESMPVDSLYKKRSLIDTNRYTPPN